MLDGTITSGPRYADLCGDADVNAALVQHLQYAIPSARPTITGTRFRSSMAYYIIGHDNLISLQLMYHFACTRVFVESYHRKSCNIE